MKLLLLHTNSINVIARKPAMKLADDIEKDSSISMENCMTVFLASEKSDERNKEQTAKRLVDECRKYSVQINVNKIMFYPYVHLTSNPSNPNCALEIIKLAKTELAKEFEIKSASFGWYKEFKMLVKGHPLAELSKTF